MNAEIQELLSANYLSGNVVRKIIEISNDEVSIDVGIKELVEIPIKFISDLKSDLWKVGATLEFLVSCTIDEVSNNQFYLDFDLLQRIRIDNRINQLLAEDITIHSKVIDSDSYGVVVEIESKTFTISNLHLCTDVPNKNLVGTVIPVKIVTSYSAEGQLLCFSHRWAVTSEKKYKCWDVVSGKVIKIESDGAWFDLKLEKLIYVPLKQIINTACYPHLPAKDLLTLNQYYELIVDIYSKSNNDYGVIILSLKTSSHAVGYKRINKIYRENIIVNAKVVNRNEFGIFVNIESFLGFIPHFHLDPKLNISNLIGTKLPLKIISFIHYGNFYSLIFLSHIYALNKVKKKSRRKYLGYY